MIIFFNGEFMQESEARVSVFDHGLLYGDGVFEGIRRPTVTTSIPSS